MAFRKRAYTWEELAIRAEFHSKMAFHMAEEALVSSFTNPVYAFRCSRMANYHRHRRDHFANMLGTVKHPRSLGWGVSNNV